MTPETVREGNKGHGVDVPVDKPLAVVVRRRGVDLLEAHQIFARWCREGDGEVELIV
jgi:hypothetical protein